MTETTIDITLPDSDQLIAGFAAIIGSRNILTNPADIIRYLVEWRGTFHGQARAVLRPGNVDEVSAIMALAYKTNSKIVPQGGNTGLVGGQIPCGDGQEFVLSLERLNKVRKVDEFQNIITVEAGITLQKLQQAAEEQGRMFPLSLASEGSCTIGGNLATNAGGVGVIAYGNARELCLGLEVVLADGRILSNLNGLRKDNTGYDLRNMFIGSEGTLGIITAATMRIYSRPSDVATAIFALTRVESATRLLALAGDISGGTMTSIELMSRSGMEQTIRHCSGHEPLSKQYPWYVLLELSGHGEPGSMDTLMLEIFSQASQSKIVHDGVIAVSQTQRNQLWSLREDMSAAQKAEGASIKHDISLPVLKISEFITRASQIATALVPGCRPVPFGHIGDGNVHFNISQPINGDGAAFLNRAEDIHNAIYELVLSLGGSISAEHGIGQVKNNLMKKIKTPLELELMQGLKNMLDPKGILNPGKLLPNE